MSATAPRLAIARQRYNPFGGAERFVERALATLAGEGLAVTLLTRSWQGAELPWPSGAVEILDPPYRGRVGRDRSFAQAVQARIGAGHFDLVQSHERIPGCQVFRAGDGVHGAWLEHRLKGRPPLLARLAALGYRLDAYHRYVQGAEAAMFAHPNLRAVICNSRLVQGEIADRFHLPPERLPVIYNGVDLARFSPDAARAAALGLRQGLGIGEDELFLLYVGSGFVRKGVPQLLEALATRAAAGGVPIRAAVVGADKEAARWARRARELGLADRVLFPGPQREVLPWYGAADALVLPTLYDPCPNAALEAMACGLPLLTSDACGAAEFLGEPPVLASGEFWLGPAGGVAPAGEAQSLARLIAALAERLAGGDWAALGAAARQQVAHLSLDAMGEAYLALYRRLLG